MGFHLIETFTVYRFRLPPPPPHRCFRRCNGGRRGRIWKCLPVITFVVLGGGQGLWYGNGWKWTPYPAWGEEARLLKIMHEKTAVDTTIIRLK